MKVQETTIIVAFYNYVEEAGKRLDGTAFLKINPEETKWYDEITRILLQKGYIDESYHYKTDDDYECGRSYFLESEDWDKPNIELNPFWITGEILTNE